LDADHRIASCCGRHNGSLTHYPRYEGDARAQAAGDGAYGCEWVRACLHPPGCERGGSTGKPGSGLWTTTVSYDAADINTNNLKNYDAIFLDSTTTCFLDDPDPSVTAARRAAFLNFVRGGKGVAGIHAATDSYHTGCVASEAAATSGNPGLNIAALVLAAWLVKAAGKDIDDTVSLQEWTSLADDWFQKLDTGNTGNVTRAEYNRGARML
jgi:hypothetical protein